MLGRYHPRPVLYVDADAEFAQFPTLFNSDIGDIALHCVDWKRFHRDRPDEVLGGTLYMRTSSRTNFVLDKWIKEC